MSRPYRITVSQAATIQTADVSTVKIHLEEILPGESMRQILREVLAEKGWQKKGGEFVKEGSCGETMRWDWQQQEVVAQIAQKEKISLKQTGKSAQKQDETLRQALRENLQEQMATQKEQITADLAKRAEKRLAEGRQAREVEINRVLLEVYARALKVKAPQIGEIKEIKEEWSNDQNVYSLTIQIQEP